MSLTSLVRQAQMGNGSYCGGNDTVDSVKQRIAGLLQSSDFVHLTSTNRTQAKNELRCACERVFADDPWLEESESDRQRVIASVIDSVFGLGPIEPLMNDDHITEVMIMGTNPIYVERDGRLERTSISFASDEQVRALIDHVVGPVGRRIDELSPTVDARLPQGYRFHAIIPPLALDGPVVTIRKFHRHVMTLSEMTQNRTIDAGVERLLRAIVRSRKNVLVSGGTDSGKTTLLNALSCEIDPSERIVTIEDSAELRFFRHPHVVRLEARPVNAEGQGEFTIRSLVANALRMRPDRIVVGECRGAEALDMLQAMNTGHDGSLTTLHANSPHDAILRLQTLVCFGMDLPLDVIEAQIASAIDYFVHVQRDASGQRFVKEIACVRSGKDGLCDLQTIYRRPSSHEEGSWNDADGDSSQTSMKEDR